ncbi:hypothetical protein RBB50_010891 [Rhinocladiella similis]
MRAFVLARAVRPSATRQTGIWQTRNLNTTRSLRQTQPPSSSEGIPEKPINFYSTHGRAFFKAMTLAFLTYQIAYWAWLTLETEEIKDQKNREIKTLEQEVRLLDESRKSQKSGS